MMDLEFDDVRVEREGRLVLEIPSLCVRAGRTTAVLGPNGSGKTTLLRLIAGLERPRTGQIRGVPLRPDVSRPNLAYVFQEQVFLKRSVHDNLELGLRLYGVEKAQRRVRVEEAANLLGIAHLLDRRADHLSGGEGRRVSLARALCLRAPLVLLDEPLEGLDERTYMRLLDELPHVLAAFNATTLLVTHDRHEALRVAQDLVVLVDGRVHAADDKRKVAMNPGVAEVAEVLGYSMLLVDGRRVAVPPGALQPGRGRREFWLVVDEVLELVESREILGRIGHVRVRVEQSIAGDIPRPGERMRVHATRSCELS